MDLIYEVNLEVEKSIQDVFTPWLKGHVTQVVATGCFEAAKIYQRDSAPNQLGLTVLYQVKSETSLEEYFKTFAPHLRKDIELRFSGKFQISRRILRAI